MTLHNVVVRPAVLHDAPAVAALLGELGYANDEKFARQKIAELPGPNDAILVAEAAGTVIGLVSVHLMPMLHLPDLLGKITSLVVANSHRQAGCGRALVAAAQRFAADRGATRIEVISGNHRPHAHRFYRTLGYTATDQTRFILPHMPS